MLQTHEAKGRLLMLQTIEAHACSLKMSMMTYRGLLKEGMAELEAAGIRDARSDSERLLMDLLGESRAFLFLHGDDLAPSEKEERYRRWIRRRIQGEPVQYITGYQEFMGLTFHVNPSVLIPRPETELLVEYALELAETLPENPAILDMCCGSGAIAVTVASALPDARVTACDLSAAALRAAEENAVRNQVLERIRFLRTDMFRAAEPEGSNLQGDRFDMILCNPPYIPTDVIKTLDVAVRDHEPRTALDGGSDGVQFYRILAEQSWEYLTPEGIILMEIGHDQADAVCWLLEQAGHYTDIRCRQDLAGLDRMVGCRLRAEL